MSTASPYLIDGPALISFSGGRTSAFMLKMILDAHGGELPADVHVCFANTGKEREETLRFVHECASRWGVRIRWLEWQSRLKSVPVDRRFAEVGFNSAARAGEPFSALIKSKRSVPNPAHRWCTEHLKLQVLADFMLAHGYSGWRNVIGLRADEMYRVFKKVAQNQAGENDWVNVMPMATRAADVRKPDVRRFWFGQDRVDVSLPTSALPQGFDLGLEEWEGNCDLCFNKGEKLLMALIRAGRVDPAWWVGEEEGVGGTFSSRFSMRDLLRWVDTQPLLPLDGDTLEEFDAECGSWCAGDAGGETMSEDAEAFVQDLLEEGQAAL